VISGDVTRGDAQEFVIDADWAFVIDDGRPGLLRDASIYVRDGVIEEVAKSSIRASVPRIDARGQILLPGFISGHSHVTGGTTTRGIVENGRLFMRPFEIVAGYSDDDIDALTELNVAELLRSGSTTHVEMSISQRHLESYVRTARRWGVRAYPGAALPGFDQLGRIWHHGDDTLLASESATLEAVEQFRRYALAIRSDLIRPMVAPHGPDTNTRGTLLACLAVARELGTGIQIHLSRLNEEVATVMRLWGCRPVEFLDQLGYFEERVFGVHLSSIDYGADLPLLTKHDTFTYVHCPSGGGAGGTNGAQPYPELLAAGVNVSIGIDTHSNDYLENLKLAVLNGRARCFLGDEPPLAPRRLPSAWDAVLAATVNGAEGLGRHDLGRIEPGARADLCTVDVTGLLIGTGATPPEPLNNLLYANGLSVRNVITDGRAQVIDGRLLVADEAEIRQRGGAVVARLWDDLRAEGWFDTAAPDEPPQYPSGWPYSTTGAEWS
jgi:cytosine/adenosine deaminase-related metal-dependent hydrolase